MNKTVLVIGIIFLLIGASVVSSTGNIEQDTQTNHQFKDTIDTSKELLSNGKIAYCYCAYGLTEGTYWFELDDPSTLNFISETETVYYLAGGTWSCEDIWYGCEYNSGGLWKIDPFDGSMENIGGGGTSCNGLTWDPINNRLYAASSTHLIEYDPETGEQETIGSFDWSNSITGIAINSYGECYAWDVIWSGSSTLLKVNLNTGEVTEVGELDCPINGAGDGHFDYDTNKLYITSGTQLIVYDLENENCTLVGDFEGGAGITCLAIPYNCSNLPPVTTISFDPPEPNGENGWYVSNVTATLNSTDSDGVDATYYRINSGEWNIYTLPFIISEEGNDILIEYYSIDNLGNVEDVKSAFLDIDKTPPNVTVEIEVKKIGCGKWLIIITITSHDNSSGMDRVEFFLNEGLQSVVSGSGPSYSWSWVMYGYMPFDIKVIIYDAAGNSFVVIINETDISYPNLIKDIFTQRSINPFILRFFERLLIIERSLSIIRGCIL